MAEIVLTSAKYCSFLKTLPYWSGGTAYRAQLPYNCLYLDNSLEHNNVLWADCNNLVKATIWGRATIPPKGSNWYRPNLYGLGDLTCEQLIDACTDISTDFSDMIPAEILYMRGVGEPDHIGSYVGDFNVTVNGNVYKCNCIEATAGFGGGIMATYVDEAGRRYNGKGGAAGGIWTKHGKLSSWIDYSEITGNDEEEAFWLYMAKRIKKYL